MKNDINDIEKSLIIPEKENIFTKFFKWVSNIFNKKEDTSYIEIEQESSVQNITVPKEVKLPVRNEIEKDTDENSLEYLYKLTDDELENIEKEYDLKMIEASSEIIKLENILQTYKQSIKKLQNQLPNEDV